MLALPFLAAITDALGLIISKFFLRRYGKLSYREFNWLVFLGILTVLVIISISFNLFPRWEDIRSHWPAVLALGGLGALGNILFSRGLEEERVSNIEPLVVFNPLAAILIASIFYPAERSWIVYGTIIIAIIILGWANIKKRHLVLNRALLSIVFFWVVYGLEITLVKQLLDVFSPVGLYLLRCSIIFVILTLVSRPDFKQIHHSHMPIAMLLGGLAVTTVVALYTAVHNLGIAASLFIMVLAPTLVYWFSGAILHDRWNRKNVIASLLVVLLVVGVTVWLKR